MKRIETEYYKPHPDKPGYVVYDKGRSVQEVFAELQRRLESAGYLPDEYFLLDSHWENGKTWPKDGDMFCTVDYGGSEGIYLDVYLKYKDESGKYRTDGFITGKTLGESDADMDRMYLIASAVTKAFHSDGVHARYIAFGGENQPEGSAIVQLNQEERKIVGASLLTERARLKVENEPLKAIEGAERLLHRIIGSITEYVRIAGDRPNWLDDHDRASLAIADGDTEAFRAVYRKVPQVYGHLLEQAAARPDAKGREMTDMLCAAVSEAAADVSYDMYLRACKAAVNTGDAARVLHMLSKAPDCGIDIDADPEFYGEVIRRALDHDEKHGGSKTHIATAIAEQCTPEQIRGADPYLLHLAIMHDDRRLANALLDKDFPVTYEPAMLIYFAAMKKEIGLAERMIQAGADVNGQNYAALHTAMRANDPASGMFLLKLGADFEGFSDAVTGRNLTENEKDFLATVKDFYDSHIKEPENMTERGGDIEMGDDD
ncbi:MAG: ankyrin repeat domain-containing protein [Gracilibacteraceae bacterium]|jgi:hypothetical protein|nr:ankyrin repeat domain-containing protein [Gracilibacteraceae bacterium]